jgi:adenylate cyclase
LADEHTRSLQHELRTPINHIVGYADLMLEEPDLPAPLAAALKEVRELARGALADIRSVVRERDDAASEARASLRARVGTIRVTVATVRSEIPEALASDFDHIEQAAMLLAALIDRSAGAGAGGASAVAEDGGDTPAGVPVVLVVDDDAANREVLRRRLERLEYRVIEAPDGARGLEVLGDGAVDVVLLDLMMPVLDGIGVLEQRQRDAGLSDIPVIMISAQDDVEPIARCIELGADDYLVKPFDPVLLQARVGASLQRKRLRDREKHLVEVVTSQADELRTWNAELERRVDEKVREVERLSLMERFVSPQLAELLRDGGAELLRSHRREIVVLFCDLRGFTPFAETSEPEDVMAVLSELHAEIGPSILQHSGTLAQFTGDGLMAIFNDPIPSDDPAWLAIQVALEMQARAGALERQWERRGHALQLSIGLAMGFATCGQIGFQDRYEYTAIGTVTNLAARLCGEAAGGQILANERLCSLVDARVQTRKVGDMALKGLARPAPVFAVEPV